LSVEAFLSVEALAKSEAESDIEKPFPPAIHQEFFVIAVDVK